VASYVLDDAPSRVAIAGDLAKIQYGLAR
jgi:hypothetical protein